VNFHNYIIIAIFSLFLLSSKTRATALVLLFVYAPYYFWALSFDGLPRYAAIATLELFAGLYLLHISKYVLFKHEDASIAETYFIAVFINVLGGVLYWNYYPHKYYDNMCITLMVVQILILSWRIFKDGKLIGRCSYLYPVFGAFVGHINKRHSFLQKGKNKSQEVKRTE
tara:strand:- start:334 stop:843 length:510 start_codon:yes stop_codon:yes gene_type:complete